MPDYGGDAYKKKTRSLLTSGAHLAAARSWIQTHAFNGSKVTWDTEDLLDLRRPLTVGQVERLAQRIRNVVMEEARSILSYGGLQPVCDKFEPTTRPGMLLNKCSNCGHHRFFHEE